MNNDNSYLERIAISLESISRVIARQSDFAADFASHLVFRMTDSALKPVKSPDTPSIESIVGLEEVKSQIINNTDLFVSGKPANDILLWGEKGNGKSTLIKSLVSYYSTYNLKLIEVSKNLLHYLPELSETVRVQPYRFILFCDDLSFTSEDTSFQGLKSILDGSVIKRPENMLVYATSNRRHLIPELWEENSGDSEIHSDEAIAEKLALSDRFGLSIHISANNQEEYLEIVKMYLAGLGIDTNNVEFRNSAVIWALSRGNRSGRTARQFAINFAGTINR